MKDKYLPLKMIVFLVSVWMCYTSFTNAKKPAYQEETPPSRFSFVQQETQSDFEPYELPRLGSKNNTESTLVSPRSAAQETEQLPEEQDLLPESREPAPAPTSKVDAAAIQEELSFLSINRPAVLIDCPRCLGWGNVQMDCAACGGQGVTAIPGITAFTASVPCSACQGSGLQRCPDCTFGMVMNPDYEVQQATWTAKRHELWGQLGYTAEEIRQMEIAEANAYLEGSGSDGSYGDEYDGGTAEVEAPPGLCRICYGSGDCATCGGDGLYQNPLTGSQLSCPNCQYTQGHCWSCGGSGYTS